MLDLLDAFETAALTGDTETALPLWKAIRQKKRPKAPVELDFEHELTGLTPAEHTRHIRQHEEEYRKLQQQLAHETDPELKAKCAELMTQCATHWDSHRRAKHCPPPADKDKLVTHATVLKKALAAEAGKPEREYSVAMLSLSEAAADILSSWAAHTIPEVYLEAKGREKDPHITVRYGLYTSSPEPVAPIAEKHLPITVMVGQTEVFPGAQFDVVVVSITGMPAGNELQALHDALGTLPHTDSFKEYRPHITLAYVQPGMGEQYAGQDTPLTGQPLTFEHLVFSNQQREVTVLPPIRKAYLTEDELRAYGKQEHRNFQKLLDGQEIKPGAILNYGGLRVRVECPEGSTRKGTGPDGPWECLQRFPYGEFLGTAGMDGDPVDVFLGPDATAPNVYVMHQHAIEKVRNWKTGQCPRCGNLPADCCHDLDEEKVFVGFRSESEALAAYCMAHDAPDRFLGPVDVVPRAIFPVWLDKHRAPVRKAVAAALAFALTAEGMFKALNLHKRHPFISMTPDGETLHVHTPHYHKPFVEALKAAKVGAKWDKEKSHWEVPGAHLHVTSHLAHTYWDASKHPKDAHGRWVKVGTPTGGKGTHPLHGPVKAALAHMAAHDPDHAGQANSVGFTGADSEFGHSLNAQAALSHKQVESALKMLGKYKNTQLAHLKDDLYGPEAATKLSHAPAVDPGHTSGVVVEQAYQHAHEMEARDTEPVVPVPEPPTQEPEPEPQGQSAVLPEGYQLEPVPGYEGEWNVKDGEGVKWGMVYHSDDAGKWLGYTPAGGSSAPYGTQQDAVDYVLATVPKAVEEPVTPVVADIPLGNLSDYQKQIIGQHDASVTQSYLQNKSVAELEEAGAFGEKLAGGHDADYFYLLAEVKRKWEQSQTTPASPAKKPPITTPVAAPEGPAILPVPGDLDHDNLRLLAPEEIEPTWGKVPEGTKVSYGGVVISPTGMLLMRRPTHGFGGYAWTFAKGQMDAGDHPVDTAVREVAEESGHLGQIVGTVPGSFGGAGGVSRFFLMRSTGMDGMQMDNETEAMQWVSPAAARELITQSHPRQMGRDLEVLEAAMQALGQKPVIAWGAQELTSEAIVGEVKGALSPGNEKPVSSGELLFALEASGYDVPPAQFGKLLDKLQHQGFIKYKGSGWVIPANTAPNRPGHQLLKESSSPLPENLGPPLPGEVKGNLGLVLNAAVAAAAHSGKPHFLTSPDSQHYTLTDKRPTTGKYREVSVVQGNSVLRVYVAGDTVTKCLVALVVDASVEWQAAANLAQALA